MKLFFTSLLMVLLFAFANDVKAQKNRIDSLFMNSDTTSLIDSLMKDFDSFLDSIAAPKSFFNASMGIGTGIFSFEDKNSVFLTSQKKLILSPSLGYFHKSGLGISATGYMINENNKAGFYQYVFTPSFDVIKRSFSTGISFSKYLSKDSVTFYTTPIQNEIFAYFSYKKWWLRPSISVSYGWGSKTEYEKRQYKIYRRLLQQSNQYYVTIKNEESINDLSLTLSLRKDFNWYDVLVKDDNITITPVILFNSGTQNFGFNTSYTYTLPAAIRVNSTPGNSNITDKTEFSPQSLSMVLRSSYLKGRFMLQPQVLFDYYLPEAEDRFNTVFSLTAAVSF
ncbi:MAG: hypothetical protein H7122_03700 [Chitinophagaceae bacterium]|nr:hypothetical protein [Chitinophagaceae bacterium]